MHNIRLSVIQVQTVLVCLLLLGILWTQNARPASFDRCRETYQELFLGDAADIPEPARFAAAQPET